MFEHSQKQDPLAERKPGTKGKILLDNRVHTSPLQMKSKVNVNDDTGLEREADAMGTKALQFAGKTNDIVQQKPAGESSDGVVQCSAIKVTADGLTSNMVKRFDEAYAQFESTILASSPLATDPNNHVVVHGISQKTHGIKDYASTLLYIGNNGYNGNDYQQFTTLWETKLKGEIPKDVGIRIVIAVNMTKHPAIDQLYTTILHEWYAHAVNWEDVIKKIRAGSGKAEVENVQKEGSKKRDRGEHKKFRSFKKTKLADMTDSLGLVGNQKDSVVSKLESDTQRFDEHGEAI